MAGNASEVMRAERLAKVTEGLLLSRALSRGSPAAMRRSAP